MIISKDFDLLHIGFGKVSHVFYRSSYLCCVFLFATWINFSLYFFKSSVIFNFVELQNGNRFMANLKVSSSRSSDITDKQSVFPPRCPFPASSSSWGDERPKSGLDSRCEQTRHRHTLSESFHIDEQPPWLDDLLNESETPVKRSAHRRSFSDSSPILGGSNFHSNITNLYVEEGSQKGYTSSSLWGLNEINNLRDGKSWEYTNYTSEHDNNAIAHNIKREDQKELVQEANCSSEMKDDSTTKRLENDSKSDKK
ncbi:uncharacterized protein LOC121981622 [Zingiber officinale]|uniref:uncharacterized protein LOC121981622 n=1 Tax=Zingiber officinale TaxID=94328 RepID=UPI001C4B998B|nr:uncharacterized protein LOC121981622 [Zingiber officinale]